MPAVQRELLAIAYAIYTGIVWASGRNAGAIAVCTRLKRSVLEDPASPGGQQPSYALER